MFWGLHLSSWRDIGGESRRDSSSTDLITSGGILSHPGTEDNMSIDQLGVVMWFSSSITFVGHLYAEGSFSDCFSAVEL